MKTGTARTLGAAVLGMAFAATAAGTASAATLALPTLPKDPGALATGVLDNASKTLPSTTRVLPGKVSGADPVSALMGGMSLRTPGSGGVLR